MLRHVQILQQFYFVSAPFNKYKNTNQLHSHKKKNTLTEKNKTNFSYLETFEAESSGKHVMHSFSSSSAVLIRTLVGLQQAEKTKQKHSPFSLKQ